MLHSASWKSTIMMLKMLFAGRAAGLFGKQFSILFETLIHLLSSLNTFEFESRPSDKMDFPIQFFLKIHLFSRGVGQIKKRLKRKLPEFLKTFTAYIA